MEAIKERLQFTRGAGFDVMLFMKASIAKLRRSQGRLEREIINVGEM